jgi:uncharacterized protein (DUF362 family)
MTTQADVSISFTPWDGAQSFVRSVLPAGSFRRVLIKPNWVKHAEHPEFPIEALVTDPRLIEAAIEACLEVYSGLESIRVADVPLQGCDWSLLAAQAGINELERRYRNDARVPISFHDLRRERWRVTNGFMVLDDDTPGDPLGYHEVVLDEKSLLEEVSNNARNFRVSDYDPKTTVSVHRRGHHRYLIAGSVLDADLVINLPKMKTHQKSGITGALKNLVGINGSKAHLVHHQKGRPSHGGDEFPENAPSMVRLQSALRESFQKRSPLLFRAFRAPWRLYKRLSGLATVATRQALAGRVYVGAGSWHGNDSIWRMVYDLNLILRYASLRSASLEATPQRATVSIIDGIVAGEGNGPLQPLPVRAGVLIGSSNPFLADLTMSRLMGFDYRKIPLIANHLRFADPEIGGFVPSLIHIATPNGCLQGIDAVPILHEFEPPPGWRNHIELVRRIA